MWCYPIFGLDEIVACNAASEPGNSGKSFLYFGNELADWAMALVDAGSKGYDQSGEIILLVVSEWERKLLPRIMNNE